jgi:hypothetical protein
MADLNDRSAASMKGHSATMAYIERTAGMMTGLIKDGSSAAVAVAALRQFHEASGEALPEWCTEGFVAEVRERMRQLLGRWKATAYRGTMEIAWPALRPAAPGTVQS